MLLHVRYLARARLTRPPCTRWQYVCIRNYVSSTETNGDPSWFQDLRDEMLRRPVVSSREYISSDTDHKLADSLSTFLPPKWIRRLDVRKNPLVPLGHNLVWFNTSMPVDQLLPDGTDPLQSPGEPWVRRMWAGGSMKAKSEDYYDFEKGFAINTDMVYAERIQDVQLRGSGDAAKIFVTIQRRYARLDVLQAHHAVLRSRGADPITTPSAVLREQILQEEGWGDAVLKEERNLVFLKEKTPAELELIAAGQSLPVKYLDSPGEPDFSHTLVPTRSLLFRYSALTLNAHLIHLDRDYARNIEGHRNLLVHGPLSLTLMLQVLSQYDNRENDGGFVIESITYRNLAPLYCDEEMRICIKKKKLLPGSTTYDIWIEGPTNGVAVMGTARTARRTYFHVSSSKFPSESIRKSSRKAPTREIPGHLRIRKVTYGDAISMSAQIASIGAQKIGAAKAPAPKKASAINGAKTRVNGEANQRNNARSSVRPSRHRPTSATPNSITRIEAIQKMEKSEHPGPTMPRSLVRRVEAPPSPVEVVPYFIRSLIHRAHRRSRPARVREVRKESNVLPSVTVAPSPVASTSSSRLRRARNATVRPKPASAAQRHSRYASQGLRKITKPSIRRVALVDDAQQQAERRAERRYLRYWR